jgi:predicted nucleic acid-binding protein
VKATEEEAALMKGPIDRRAEMETPRWTEEESVNSERKTKKEREREKARIVEIAKEFEKVKEEIDENSKYGDEIENLIE